MVVDARRSNLRFHDPDFIPLASGSSFGEIELGDEQLFVGHGDLCDAFYHFSLPEALRPFFGLAPVRAMDVGLTTLNGVSIPGHQLVWPRLAVMPMGWSHAAWWCQRIHMHIVRAAPGVDDEHYLHDAEAPPAPAEGAHTQYLDNFICYSTQSESVAETTTGAMQALEDAGLDVHE
eukprot:11202628-Lingulodinium_polyedra.AAC.1